MAGGARGPNQPGYRQNEYSQPWGGLDVSKPGSQIAPGACTVLEGAIVRGALTNPPVVIPLNSDQGKPPIVGPAFSPGEAPLLETNLSGATIIITGAAVYTDYCIPGASTQKIFQKIFNRSIGSGRVSSVIIGDSLYFSSVGQLGIFKVFQTTVTEITAQNGSGAFIGGGFLFTLANRLCIGDVTGGDGNQTGSVASVTVTNGGSGYPPTGSVLFTGGGGQSATGTFTSTGGVITAITITNPGTGFLSAPTPEIVGTLGTGFAGTTTITGFTSNSTTVARPDYVAWSFPNSYGSFDPNSTLLGGGFNQITEARGQITGVAVFEAVGMIAHNGGFTEMVPNTSSAVGLNIQPFTFAPLWSADQGIVCRYGSLAQYGAMCCFLGFDQPYFLSPSGLNPFGDEIASLVQNYSQWNNIEDLNGGLFGSIVEVEGEKHYIITFADDAFTNPDPATQNTLFYDCNLKTKAWSSWSLPICVTAPIYQSYDNQPLGPFNLNGQIVRDNWICLGYIVGNPTVVAGSVSQLAYDEKRFQSGSLPLFGGPLNCTFGNDASSMNAYQVTRRFMVEYENISELPQCLLTWTLDGQPKPGGFPSTDQTPVSSTNTLILPYYDDFDGTVLTAFSDPLPATANSLLAMRLSLSASQGVRIIRTALAATVEQPEQL